MPRDLLDRAAFALNPPTPERDDQRLAERVRVPRRPRARLERWHGATATAAMTHLAIQERLDGKAVTWMEPVTEGSFDAAAGTPGLVGGRTRIETHSA
jgi:hypothetical protein